ncbi:cardiolipin synthase [Robiginitalea myxolifaciens]|uniref:Cardiolipin synthase n=1 Tax=Robiginitalea myxolifaciens TaxID=400055 RepID=A0A1I6FMP0_9FLAO|nr:cardiolipin synthase [Robiginitalea myxolifaciens]SFR31222.1 cardiolipin synthase [Robiginitalea myxolifaciens]
MADWFNSQLWKFLLLGNYIFVVILSVVVLLKNRNPSKTMAYIFALATLPFIGLLVYYLFGMDYRKDKIFTRKYLHDNKRLKSWRKKFREDDAKVAAFARDNAPWIVKLHELLEFNERSILTFENQVDILQDGEAKFKCLKEDLKKAERHIHIEYFVLRDDVTGISILNILCEKAEQGVAVRLIYDSVGSSLSRKTKKRLDDSGIEHHPFMPVVFTRFTSKFNYRDHRKIVVIDGQVGFVGGINIKDEYDNSIGNSRYWRDTHLRLEGPAAGSLQAIFLLSWEFVSGERPPEDADLFPNKPSSSKDPVAIQIASSGPDSDWANIMEALFMAINNAHEYVYITTPYFIPNSAMKTALSTAARCGVDVRILIPYKSDSWVAQYATDSFIEELIEAGVKIYRYKKGFVHSKTMAVDDVLASVGTANLDYRSFSINFEVNALLYGQSKAKEVKEVFLEDIEEAELVDLERWEARGITRKLKESVTRLVAPLL